MECNNMGSAGNRAEEAKVNGVMITESGLLAVVHPVGIEDAREAFNSHDLTSKRDGNGITVKDYAESFGGYNIDAVK